MKIHFTAKNLFAFFLLGVLLFEAHEISHFIVGKIICGTWPVSRDFNAWSLGTECDEAGLPWYLATAMGPVFSMSLAWVGMFWIRSIDHKKQSLGFCLIWANVPEARLITVFMGGGDEMVVIRELTQGTWLSEHFRWIATILVCIMALPPIIESFGTLKQKYSFLINLAFMTAPLVIWGIYLHVLGNKLLFSGFLVNPWIMGTPLLITLHTFVVLIIMFFFKKYLFTFVKESSSPAVA